MPQNNATCFTLVIHRFHISHIRQQFH